MASKEQAVDVLTNILKCPPDEALEKLRKILYQVTSIRASKMEMAKMAQLDYYIVADHIGVCDVCGHHTNVYVCIRLQEICDICTVRILKSARLLR